jgi:2-oxoglutarate dehydrogenase E1 component
MYGGQDRRGVRKPLILFTPKSLLRHPKVVSGIPDFTGGGFREILGETDAIDPHSVSRILLCSGKVYYDLIEAREQREARQVAIVRVEQLYPFASSQLGDILLKYPPAADVFWVQEEPRNMGPWRFMRERIQPLLDPTERVLRFAGRAESASPATGSHKRHAAEQAALIDEAFAPAAMPSRSAVRIVARRKAK